MKKNKTVRITLALVFAAVVASAVVAGSFDGAGAASEQKEAEKAYKTARKALNSEEYRDAARQFAEIYDEYPDTKYAARALYWQAYSQYKLGGKSEFKRGAFLPGRVTRRALGRRPAIVTPSERV